MLEQFADHRRDGVGFGGRPDGLEVASGTEGAAFAFDHQHANGVVRFNLQAELFEFPGDRKVDRVERGRAIKPDGGDWAFDAEQRRIVGKGGGGGIGRRHLKSSGAENVAWYLNSRTEEVTIPAKSAKCKYIFPHFASCRSDLMTQGTVLIVGAGHAGFQVAASLRQHGFAERICLINDEAHLPYQRPPLSKAYLKGEGRPDSLMFRPDKFYREQKIELIADRAAAIDRGAHRLLLASGSSLDYGHLVLATGARNRLLDLPNANLKDVRYLRILDESEALRQRIASARHVVVIGAGFIGLEFAATARAKGL